MKIFLLNSLIVILVINSLFAIEQPHDYINANAGDVTFFDFLPNIELPKLVSRASNPSDTLNVDVLGRSVYELMVITKDNHSVINIAASASAFAINVNEEIQLVGSFHAFSHVLHSGVSFAVIARGLDGKCFHINKFHGSSRLHDIVYMKPSVVLLSSIPVAMERPNSLDTLYACGSLGSYTQVFRKGEFMVDKKTFFLTSIPATRRSSGSPVFNSKGLLVGMITEVIPVLRQSELHYGDHFAEIVITKCQFIQ